jgi:glucokinase
MSYAIGLDLGGTNIKGLAVTISGNVLAEINVPTGDAGDKAWVGNVERARVNLRKRIGKEPDFIGVAAPGLVARDHRSIAFMPERLQGLENLVWQEYFDVSHPVPVLNDAQAALLGEVWRGAARGSSNVILLTLGTAVGGAAMIDGRLLHGHLGRAGHFGHLSLDPQGDLDITGTPGSLEDAIGDTTIQKRSQGRFDSTRALTNAVRRGDRDATRIWQDSVRGLAAATASLINILDPDVVILGGGITRAGATLSRPLKRFLDKFEWRPGGSKARILRAKLGDRAGAFGAAWNAVQFSSDDK